MAFLQCMLVCPLVYNHWDKSRKEKWPIYSKRVGFEGTEEMGEHLWPRLLCVLLEGHQGQLLDGGRQQVGALFFPIGSCFLFCKFVESLLCLG